MSPRRSQERPKRPQDGPKSALRAARNAPRGAQEQPGAHQKGPKRAPGRPRSAKKPPGAIREAPGVHFGIILGGSGLHFQAIEASFSKLARAPPDNRKHSSKSLVKRSCVGLAGVWGQKTQPRRGIHVFLRTIRDPRSEIRRTPPRIRDPRSEIQKDFFVYESNLPPRRAF